MRKRILLLITDLQIGGTPTVVRELAIRLAPFAEVQVACLATWGPTADDIAAAGINVTALNACGPADLRIVSRLFRLIDEQRIDTVFSFLIHANAVASLVKQRRPGVRLIQSIQTTQRKPRWHWWLQRLAQQSAETDRCAFRVGGGRCDPPVRRAGGED